MAHLAVSLQSCSVKWALPPCMLFQDAVRAGFSLKHASRAWSVMQQMLKRSVDRMKTSKGVMLDDQHTVTGNAAQRSGTYCGALADLMFGRPASQHAVLHNRPYRTRTPCLVHALAVHPQRAGMATLAAQLDSSAWQCRGHAGYSGGRRGRAVCGRAAGRIHCASARAR